MLTIAKVLNNNIALVVDASGRDCIAMGCGIAFKKSRGDVLAEREVERLFTQHVPELSKRLDSLVKLIPEEYFEAAQAIVEHAKLRLGRDLDDSIYLALTDHIHFAVERARKGVVVGNRLTLDTKMVYREEFECAEAALAYIERVFEVELPKDEAAFITLHFVNASTGAGMDATVEAAQLIQRLLGIIEDELGTTFDRDSLSYYRFMIHLRFFVQRIVVPDARPGDGETEDLRMLALVRQQYGESFACAERVANYVERERGVRVSANERTYLTVHIERVRSDERRKRRREGRGEQD